MALLSGELSRLFVTETCRKVTMWVKMMRGTVCAVWGVPAHAACLRGRPSTYTCGTTNLAASVEGMTESLTSFERQSVFHPSRPDHYHPRIRTRFFRPSRIITIENDHALRVTIGAGDICARWCRLCLTSQVSYVGACSCAARIGAPERIPCDTAADAAADAASSARAAGGSWAGGSWGEPPATRTMLHRRACALTRSTPSSPTRTR